MGSGASANCGGDLGTQQEDADRDEKKSAVAPPTSDIIEEDASFADAPIGALVATLDSSEKSRLSGESGKTVQSIRQRLLLDTSSGELGDDDVNKECAGGTTNASKASEADDMSTAEQLALAHAIRESKRDREGSRSTTEQRVEDLAVSRAIAESKMSSRSSPIASSSRYDSASTPLYTTPSSTVSATTTTMTTRRPHERENAAVALAIAESTRQEYRGVEHAEDDELARALEESEASHRLESKRAQDQEEDRVRRAIELSMRESQESKKREDMRRLKEEEELQHALAVLRWGKVRGRFRRFRRISCESLAILTLTIRATVAVTTSGCPRCRVKSTKISR